MTKAGSSTRQNAVAKPASLVKAMGLRGTRLLSGALSALAHSSHGADHQRQRLYDAADQTVQFKTFLSEWDNPFCPEPFGPRSRT